MNFLELCKPFGLGDSPLSKPKFNTKPQPNNNTTTGSNNRIEKKFAFEAYHKKTNIKFAEKPTEVNRAVRQMEMNNHRKAKRTEAAMNRRGISASTNNTDSTLNSSEKSLSTTMLTSTSNKSKTGSTSDSGSTSTTSSRHQQLQQWKVQKTVLQSTLKDKKPAFKAGVNLNTVLKAPPVTIKAPVVATAARATNNLNAKPVVSTLKTETKSTRNPPETERRVTRAMSKTVTIPVKNGSAATILKKDAANTAVAEMKKLAINGENRSKTATGPQPKPTRGDAKKPTTTEKPGSKKLNIAAEPSKDASFKARPNSAHVEKKAAEVVIQKKLKPQAIDGVYTEHNLTFSQTCSKLTNYSKYWRNVLDTTPDIPDDIRDDIISVLGSSKLLLDSKLPQFGQLLYSYLCKELDPGPILECDLQGWWDVASIQVSSVYARFEDMDALKLNNWTRKTTKSLPPSGDRKNKATAVNGTKIANSPAKIAAKPSRGIKEFLAMKRKGAKTGLENIETSTSSNSDIAGGSLPNSQTTTFEGGFFVINSPARAATPTNRRLSVLQLANTSMTPNKPARSSSTRFSLLALSMRQSMGAMYAPGARIESISTPSDISSAHSNPESMET